MSSPKQTPIAKAIMKKAILKGRQATVAVYTGEMVSRENIDRICQDVLAHIEFILFMKIILGEEAIVKVVAKPGTVIKNPITGAFWIENGELTGGVYNSDNKFTFIMARYFDEPDLTELADRFSSISRMTYHINESAYGNVMRGIMAKN